MIPKKADPQQHAWCGNSATRFLSRRRDFITLLGGAGVAWPLAARAQQAEQVQRVGVLMGHAEDDPDAKARLAGFRQGLESLGWLEGRNIRLDIRFARGGGGAQVQVLAKELVALQPEVILAHTTPLVAALRRETVTIPIVFANITDPVGSSFVASLARPGGNVTGLLLFEASITSKWLALLKEVAPHLARAALVVNPQTAPLGWGCEKPTILSDRRQLLRPPLNCHASGFVQSPKSHDFRGPV